MFKEYSDNDYKFKDEAGNTYICSPEQDVNGTIVWILCLYTVLMFILPVALSI